MNATCQTPDRNMCAPDGKLAALFVDVDGTLIVCQPYFDAAMEEFAELMKLCGFDRQEARETLHNVYYGSMPHRGFERHKFAEGIAEAYHVLAKKHKIRRRPIIANICERIGRAPFFNPPVLFEYALPVLTRARHNYMIVAVTVGNREAQKYKIRQGGLSAVFDDTIITLSENKAQLVAEYMEDMNISPKHSAFIGNSIRSDGASLSKTNFIYLPLETSLASASDKLPENTGFQLYRAKDWHEVEESCLNRQIRVRRRALRAEEANKCTGCKTSPSTDGVPTGTQENDGTGVD